METSMIERLNKSRYNLLKWSTVGWAIWFGTFTLNDVIDNSIMRGTIALIGVIGSAIWAINFIKIYKLSRELRLDSKLNNALNDELHQFNGYKSVRVGYFVAMGITALFLCFSEFFMIPALIVTKITLYFGVLSVLISALIYNRD